MVYYLPSLTYYYNIYSVQEESSKIKKKQIMDTFVMMLFHSY